MIFKKELQETLQSVRDWLACYNISVAEAYSTLYNACMDYDYSLEDLFYDYIDENTAEEMAKHELEEGWLARLYYFLGDVNPNACELYRLNGYGNLEEARYSDIEDIIDEIENRIGEDDEDEEEEKQIEDTNGNVCTIK